MPPTEEIWLINPDTFDNPEELKRVTESMKKHSLNFQLEDIQYLIYDSEEQKAILINTLQAKIKTTEEEISKKIFLKKYSDILMI